MLWMDVLLGMELEEILRLVPCCHWIKTEVNQGVKNSSLATRAEHPAAELKKLPIHCLNLQLVWCCLPGGMDSAKERGWASVQRVLQPGGWLGSCSD